MVMTLPISAKTGMWATLLGLRPLKGEQASAEAIKGNLFTTIAICTSPSCPVLRDSLLSLASDGLPRLDLGLNPEDMLVRRNPS